MTTPSWLEQREASVRAGLNAYTHFVLLSGHPFYKLVAVPAQGKFTCVVTQTNNGKRLDNQKSYNSDEEALNGGLEELREKLGW
jgi:hypothetical protein